MLVWPGIEDDPLAVRRPARRPTDGFQKRQLLRIGAVRGVACPNLHVAGALRRKRDLFAVRRESRTVVVGCG